MIIFINLLEHKFYLTKVLSMKKIIGLFSLTALLVVGCTKSAINEESTALDGETGALITHRSCASQEVLQAQLLADPTLASRMEAIENVTARFANHQISSRLLADGTIEIPVVVNVLYKTAAQNISDAQITNTNSSIKY